MKKLVVTLAGIITMLIILFGCKKTDSAMPLDENLRKHFSYQPGTYWIYKDSVNGQIDSFAVVDNIPDVYDFGQGTFHGINVGIVAYSYGTVYDTGYDISWLLQGKSIDVQITGFPYAPVRATIVYPFVKGSVAAILDEIAVSGNTYKNVAVIGTDSESSLYVTEEVGIVKMRFLSLSNTPIWELQRCKIVLKQ